MYFAAKKLGRYQLAESPTTAMVLHSLRMRRKVLMSVVSLIRKVRKCAAVRKSGSLSPALPASGLLQFRMPLFFRHFAQLLHRCKKTLEISVIGGQKAAETGYQLGVCRHRHKPGV